MAGKLNRRELLEALTDATRAHALLWYRVGLDEVRARVGGVLLSFGRLGMAPGGLGIPLPYSAAAQASAVESRWNLTFVVGDRIDKPDVVLLGGEGQQRPGWLSQELGELWTAAETQLTSRDREDAVLTAVRLALE